MSWWVDRKNTWAIDNTLLFTDDSGADFHPLPEKYVIDKELEEKCWQILKQIQYIDKSATTGL